MENVKFLRITPKDGVDIVPAVQEWLTKHTQSYVGCKEISEAGVLHYHICCRSEVDKEALRASLKYKLRVGRDGAMVEAGNKGISFTPDKVRDEEDTFRYICKGASRDELPDIVFFYRLVDDRQGWIRSKHVEYWSKNEELKATAKRKRTGERVSIADRLDLFAAQQNRLMDPSEFRAKLIDEYIRLCVEDNKAISVYAARSVVNGKLAKYSDAGRYQLHLAIYEKM